MTASVPVNRCQLPTCRGWANRSGFCPQHDEGARGRGEAVGTDLFKIEWVREFPEVSR